MLNGFTSQENTGIVSVTNGLLEDCVIIHTGKLYRPTGPTKLNQLYHFVQVNLHRVTHTESPIRNCTYIRREQIVIIEFSYTL